LKEFAMSRTIHGGNIDALVRASGLEPSRIVDASANLNPLGAPEWLDCIWEEVKRDAGRYPDPEYRELREAAFRALDIPPDCFVFGNGADEIFYALARALRSSSDAETRALVVEPSYASYREALESAGFMAGSLFLRMENGYRFEPEILAKLVAKSSPGSSLWFGRPNNPTGLALDVEEIATIADANPAVWIVVDEAFIDFLDAPEGRASGRGASSVALLRPNIIVLRSMTKFWSVPGIRLGYLVAAPEVARAVRELLPTWPVSCLALRFGLRAFADPGTRSLRTRHLVDYERRRMRGLLAAIPGLQVFPSDANYFLCRIESGPEACDIAAALAARGIGVRDCSNYPGLDSRHIRIGLRRPDDNDAVARALGEVLASAAADTTEAPDAAPASADATDAAASLPVPAGFVPVPAESVPRAAPRRARALMIQGCSSSAGKSLVAAAFCRILRDEGYDVAPYKAQNMSLNSAVTDEGLEIGRAQALQAAACGLAADVRMNPVLLKPSTDSSSQVILMGRPVEHLAAKDYYDRVRTMRETAYAAYDSLAAEHEVIVLEGAGSPGEINLKSRDFVNMRAAFHAKASVLLVGDIDRGGVFASFIGHVATFSPAEKDVLAGFIVNKFRGDPALLGDAFELTRKATGKPVLGCVPMIRELELPDEDEPRLLRGDKPGAALSIAVLRLRRVSNFTDLDPLDAEPGLAILPVSTGAELASRDWDAVIIPGTKATVADLEYLRGRGVEAELKRLAAAGVAIVGICGGLQMLGERILDPDLVESGSAETAGFGLLPLVTSFARDKTLRRVKALHRPSGIDVSGYEIHHGATWMDAAASAGTGSAAPAAGAAASTPTACESGAAAAPCAATFFLADPSSPPARASASDSPPSASASAASAIPVGWQMGSVWGSYLHGIFDGDAFRGHFLDTLRARRGLPAAGAKPFRSLDAELDRLARIVRESCDIPAILKSAGLLPGPRSGKKV
jgi:cobyric acid synthase CobQ